jgi:polyvinyl alcohol dehydrogenase (cytochrome)
MRRHRFSSIRVLLPMAAAALTVLAAASPAEAWPPPGAAGSVPQYMYDIGHTGYQPNSSLNPRAATALQARLAYNPDGNTTFDSIFAQPIYSQGRVYVGDWDGNEYAFTPGGQIAWRTYLGRTVAHHQPSGCQPPVAGVSSTPTIVRLTVRGRPTDVLFVGGGGPQNPRQPSGPVYFYALDAHSGAILWRHQIGVAPQQFVWSSPTYYRGSVYLGVASFGDCPEVQGQVLKLDAATGALQAQYDTVPDACRGGAVWSSPTVDPRTGAVYVTTGNGVLTGSIQNCTNSQLQHAWAILKLRTGDLQLVDQWQVPAAQRDRVSDSDFGTTPTLFRDRAGRLLVGASNKNGLYYAWDREHLSAGPVWSVRVAPGGACPQCGQAAISPAAFDGSDLYAAGGLLTVDGRQCGGNVQAIEPTTGRVEWIHCFPAGPKPPPAVLGAVTATPSLVVVGSAQHLVVLDKHTGRTLYDFTAPAVSGKPPAYFWGAPEVAGDRIWAGNMAGGFYQFSPGHH